MRIASRYRPFSHQAGTTLLLPGSSVVVTAYPTCLAIGVHQQVYTLRWALSGIIQQFTAEQDLENHTISVSGFASEGYFRYLLLIKDKKLVVKLDRGPQEGLEVRVEKIGCQDSSYRLAVKQELCLHASLHSTSAVSCVERISFGVAKSQDWDLIRRRQQPVEYLPFWFSLGQTFNSCLQLHQDKSSDTSSLHLLEQASQALERRASQEALDKLHQIFMTSFHSLLVPSNYDCNFQGLSTASKSFALEDLNLSLLYQGYLCIRKFIVSVKEHTIHVLNYLPPTFHSGRAMNLSLEGAMIDLEWSKKQIKRLTLTVFEKQTFLFSFQKDLKTFRLKRNSEKKGVCTPCSKALCLEPGMYTLDQFRK